jgi:hypothetical protein
MAGMPGHRRATPWDAGNSLNRSGEAGFLQDALTGIEVTYLGQ